MIVYSLYSGDVMERSKTPSQCTIFCAYFYVLVLRENFLQIFYVVYVGGRKRVPILINVEHYIAGIVSDEGIGICIDIIHESLCFFLCFVCVGLACSEAISLSAGNIV